MPRHRRFVVGCSLHLIALTLAFTLQAQELQRPLEFTKTEVMVPMRDGVHLHTVIFTPVGQQQSLPIMFQRTPYGASSDAVALAKSSSIQALAEDGYVFVYQDVRGRFESEGEFVMMSPAPNGAGAAKRVDESTDAYDTIEWLLNNVPKNNGRVGMWGISYGGWLTTMALLGPHPALKAASEQASPEDQFLGDDFHHNGAFRLSYGFEYAALLESAKTANTNFKFDRFDTYEWYLQLGALSHATERYFHGAMPTWNDFVAHPNYDVFWQKLAFAPYLKKPTVPNLNVAGWWDQEDFYGPVKIYELMEKQDDRHLNYIVIGPWNHGGWARSEGKNLGEIQFDSSTSEYFRKNVQAPWFAFWLHDKGSLPLREALTFQTGSNRWEQYDAWPPRKNITRRDLYFRANGQLSFDPPKEGEEEADSYISDPANPVPYRRRPISPTYPGPDWKTWLVDDQRFVDHRPDVLTYQTEPLDHDVVITGDIVARLLASTSGTDSDWIVKLIDVYPEDYPQDAKMGGYQLMIADDVFRGRFRNSFEHPEPIKPNKVTEYIIGLHTNNHAFLKGHKIMVQVQSTWFPVIDRNPQKFVPNIFEAKDSDYKKATQRVFHSHSAASHIDLPIVTSP